MFDLDGNAKTVEIDAGALNYLRRSLMPGHRSGR